jgi:hypothetical protein
VVDAQRLTANDVVAADSDPAADTVNLSLTMCQISKAIVLLQIIYCSPSMQL